MALTASVSFNVPDLPDNDTWFVNAAAWHNYWGSIDLTATFNPAATTKYVPTPYDASIPPTDLIIDSVHNVVVSLAMFNSLVAQVQSTDQALQNLRTQLKDAGFITNAQ